MSRTPPPPSSSLLIQSFLLLLLPSLSDLSRIPNRKGKQKKEKKSRVSLHLHSLDQGRDDPDYESDPEETRRSLVMRRRRAASDDEEDRAAADGGRTEELEEGQGDHVKRVVRVQSDESEGEGAAPEYDDDDDEEYYSEGFGEGKVGYREDGVAVVDGGVILPLVVRNDRVIDDEGGSENVEWRAREAAGV